MDRQLLHTLYQEHGWHVHRRCLKLLGNPDEASDVSQEIFIKLMRSWDKIRDRRHVLPWLYRVATNACIDRIRLRKHHDPDPIEQLTGHGDPQSDTAARDLVTKLLDQFPAEDRMLAVLRYIDECTLEEMEEICGLTRKTISKRLTQLRIRAQKFRRSSQFLEEVCHDNCGF